MQVNGKIPLRDRKSAKIRLQILDCAMKLIGDDGTFRDIHVEQIADKAEISRATLFNYFSQKEDIMIYAFEVWNFQRMVEQRLNVKSGVKAIRHLFFKGAETYSRQRGLALSVVSLIANIRQRPKKVSLSYAERAQIYPEIPWIEEVEVTSLYTMFKQHVDEAREKKEIFTDLSTREIARLLESAWFGVLLTAHIHNADIHQLSREHLRSIFTALGVPKKIRAGNGAIAK